MKIVIGIIGYIVIGVACGKAMGFSGVIDIIIWPVTGVLKLWTEWKNKH